MTLLTLCSRLRAAVPTAALLALALVPVAAAAAPGLLPPAAPLPAVRAAAAPAAVPGTPATGGAEGVEGVWPLRPRPAVVHRFDPPTVRWGRGHRGVDLAGRTGQLVRAAVAGRVTFAGRIAGVGTVAVGHGATRTTYQPVDPAVRRGEPVAAGQPLGRLAWHGTHCAPAACLHWGLLRGERYLDPLSLLDTPGPVRLLPAA